MGSALRRTSTQVIKWSENVIIGWLLSNPHTNPGDTPNNWWEDGDYLEELNPIIRCQTWPSDAFEKYHQKKAMQSLSSCVGHSVLTQGHQFSKNLHKTKLFYFIKLFGLLAETTKEKWKSMFLFFCFCFSVFVLPELDQILLILFIWLHKLKE